MENHKDPDARLAATRERARISPIRSQILDLLEPGAMRPADPQQLLEVLHQGDWQVSLAQVNYHLRWLADAKLIPAPCHGG